MNLAVLLERWAASAPDRPALIHGETNCSFAGLAEASTSGAALLAAAGVGRGDHVLVLTPMAIPLYEVLLACWRLGAVVVVVDPAAGASAFTQAVERLRPQVFIGSGRALLLRWLHGVLRRIPTVIGSGFPWWHRSWRRRRAGPVGTAPVDLPPSAPALITFTSGSTGTPKGAVRSHGLLAAQHAALARALGHEAGSCELATLPIFALASLASGMTTVIPAVDLGRVGRVDGTRVRATIVRHRVRSCTASPAFFARLLDGAPLPLERAHTGGAPVFPAFWAQLDAALGAGAAIAVFGSTEAEPIAHTSWAAVTEADRLSMASGGGLLAGPVVPETELRILALQRGSVGPWSELDLAAATRGVGEAGEIVVAGEHVLPGYLDGIGDAEAKIRVGERVWHRTGDTGYRDAAGRLWLLGRSAATISDPRGDLHPFAVEAAAMSHPGPRRAACLAVDGRRLLVIEGQLAPAAGASLRDRFALDAIVHRTIPVDRRHNAKVDHPRLRLLLAKDNIR